MYKERFIKSFKNLHILLFIPDLVMLTFTLLAGFFFAKSSNFTQFLTDANRLADSLETLIPLINEFVQKNILVISIYLTIFFIGGFIIGSGMIAMKFGMMKDVVEKKKLSFSKMYEHSAKNFWKVVWLRLTVFLISLVVLVVFGLLFGLNIINPFYKSVFFVLILLLFVFTLIFLKFLLLFRYPALFFDNKNSIQTIKNLYSYLINNFKHVFITWIIIFLIGLIILLLDVSLNIAQVAGLLLIMLIIRYIINLVYTVWSNMFLFYSYKLKWYP